MDKENIQEIPEKIEKEYIEAKLKRVDRLCAALSEKSEEWWAGALGYQGDEAFD